MRFFIFLSYMIRTFFLSLLPFFSFLFSFDSRKKVFCLINLKCLSRTIRQDDEAKDLKFPLYYSYSWMFERREREGISGRLITYLQRTWNRACFFHGNEWINIVRSFSCPRGTAECNVCCTFSFITLLERNTWTLLSMRGPLHWRRAVIREKERSVLQRYKVCHHQERNKTLPCFVVNNLETRSVRLPAIINRHMSEISVIFGGSWLKKNRERRKVEPGAKRPPPWND